MLHHNKTCPHMHRQLSHSEFLYCFDDLVNVLLEIKTTKADVIFTSRFWIYVTEIVPSFCAREFLFNEAIITKLWSFSSGINILLDSCKSFYFSSPTFFNHNIFLIFSLKSHNSKYSSFSVKHLFWFPPPFPLRLLYFSLFTSPYFFYFPLRQSPSIASNTSSFLFLPLLYFTFHWVHTSPFVSRWLGASGAVATIYEAI